VYPFCSGSFVLRKTFWRPLAKLLSGNRLATRDRRTHCGLWPRFRATAAVLIAASTVLASLLLLNCGIDKIAQRDSVARLIRLADERGYSNLRVGALHTIDRTAQFYASGRLLYGPDREPAKLESSAEVLAAARENNGPC